MPTRLCMDCRVNPAVKRGRCGECNRALARDRSTERRARQSFYASRPWRMTRKRHLSLHPLCEYLIDGKPCDLIASVVHHVVDLADGGAPRDHSNLQSLCKSHHDQITRGRQQTR
jgi:5-methylcytosine-specific restriction endonuclease McrA